jgi:hypothetical protein
MCSVGNSFLLTMIACPACRCVGHGQGCVNQHLRRNATAKDGLCPGILEGLLLLFQYVTAMNTAACVELLRSL